MGYDRGDSFPFDFEPNGIPFGSKWKGKLSPRSYPIQFERKYKSSFPGVRTSSEWPLQLLLASDNLVHIALTGTTTPISRELYEKLASLRTILHPPVHHSTLFYRGSPTIDPPLFRETLVS